MLSDEGMRRLFERGATIGISGAAGAGKTTFANRLAEIPGAILHSEGVREWLKTKELKYADLSAQQIVDLQLYLLDRIERSSATIFDRTPLDALTYAQVSACGIELEGYRARATALLKRMSLIVFFLPNQKFLVDDGIRIADLRHQTEIAARMFLNAVEMGIVERTLVYDHSIDIEDNLTRLTAYISAHNLSP